MLRIFICEDNAIQRGQIEKIINNYVLMEDLDMEIAVSSQSPDDIITYLLEHTGISGLYFLDMDLGCEMDGIALAEKIRMNDPRGFIVFVTVHAETLPLTFEHKVEALDFVTKDNFLIAERICSCVQDAYLKYSGKNSELLDNFVFKVNRNVISVKRNSILYFMASQNAPHKITIYTDGEMHSFYGKISELEDTLGDIFFRCHQSFIINLRRVKRIDEPKKLVYLDDGSTCCISNRHLRKLVDAVQVSIK